MSRSKSKLRIFLTENAYFVPISIADYLYFNILIYTCLRVTLVWKHSSQKIQSRYDYFTSLSTMLAFIFWDRIDLCYYYRAYSYYNASISIKGSCCLLKCFFTLLVGMYKNS